MTALKCHKTSQVSKHWHVVIVTVIEKGNGISFEWTNNGIMFLRIQLFKALVFLSSKDCLFVFFIDF